MKKLIKNDQVELSSCLIRNNSIIGYQNVPINKNDLILVGLSIPKQSEENKLSLIKLKISTTGAESGFKFKVHNQPYIANETDLFDYISQLNDDDVVATYSKETASDEYIDLTKVTFNDSGTKLVTNLIIENNYDISNNPNDFCITPFGLGDGLRIYVNNISGIRKDNPLLAFNITEDSTIYVNLLTGKEICIRSFNDGINNYNIMGCFKWDACNQRVGLNFEFNNKYQILNEDLLERTNLNKNSPHVIIKDYASTEHYYSFLERKAFEQEKLFEITRDTDANVFYNEEDHSLLIKLCGFYHILYPDDSRIIMEKRDEYLYVIKTFNNYLDKTVYEYENNDIVRISSVDGEITFREDDNKLKIYFSKTNKYMYASRSGVTWPIDQDINETPEIKDCFNEYLGRIIEGENHKTNQILVLEYINDKVSRVKIANGEFSDGVFSTNLVINYYNNYTEVTDIINSKKMFYYFDNEGRIKEIVSNTSKRKSLVYTGNNLTKSVIQKEYAKEEIKNGSFENNLDHWFNASNVSVVDGVISNKCLKANSGASLTQTITLEQGNKYKICGSVKFEDITESANNVIVIEASYYTHQTENNEIVQNPIHKWFNLGVVLDGTKRGWHNFASNEVTLPTDAYDINAILNIYVEDTLYLDEIRLNEKKNTTYNLFENGNLENITQNMPDGFITENLDETDTIVEDPIYHLHPKEVGKHAFKISGIDFFNQKVKKIKKVLQISGSKNDIFTAGVLVKANTNSNELSRLYILVNYLHFEKVYYFDASNYLNIYQKVFGSFIAEDDFTSVEIGYEYNGTSTLLLDGFELYKDLSATQSMFSNDNLVSTGNVSKPTILQYSNNGFLTKIIDSNGLYKELTYSRGNVSKEEDIYGNIVEYGHDSKNRVTVKIITSYKGEEIAERYLYDISSENNNEFIVYTDPFGKESRIYKNNNDLVFKEIYPNNLNVLYEYNKNDNLYSIRALSDGTELSKNDLRYIHDDIMSSATLNNGTYYNFTYNDYYDLTSVSTVTGKIETYEYDTANPNLLKKLNYKFGLDETINEVVPIGYYEYIYDEENNLSKILRYENNLLKEERILIYIDYIHAFLTLYHGRVR